MRHSWTPEQTVTSFCTVLYYYIVPPLQPSALVQFGGWCLGDAIFRGAPWLVQYFLVQLEGAPPDTGAAPPGFGGCTSFAPVLHPPALAVHPFCTPLAPSKVLDFGILPMYLSFQVHLWSSVLWMLEEYQYGEGSIMSYLEFVLRTCTFASIINLLFTSGDPRKLLWSYIC